MRRISTHCCRKIAPAPLRRSKLAVERPTIESVHRDIGLANSYRMELLKHLLTISAALFAFTVAFRPKLDDVHMQWAMWAGWIGLGVSMVGGMIHMLGWDHYYKSYRDFDWKYRNDPDRERGKREGQKKRGEINAWRGLAMWAQYVGFAIGVLGVGAFAAANLNSAQKHTDRTTACGTHAVVLHDGHAASMRPSGSVTFEKRQ